MAVCAVSRVAVECFQYVDVEGLAFPKQGFLTAGMGNRLLQANHFDQNSLHDRPHILRGRPPHIRGHVDQPGRRTRLKSQLLQIAVKKRKAGLIDSPKIFVTFAAG
jgi:hypothetical protein